jgi:hypothetical protein
MTQALRIYEASECGADGYPRAWHDLGDGKGVKHLVRDLAGHRCVRCSHPFECGVSKAAWSPCDERCTHGGPFRCATCSTDRAQVWPVSTSGTTISP